MNPLEETKRLAETHSIEFVDCGNGHVQLKGHGNLVNYYPLSKRKTLYSPTLDRRESNCSPWDAVRLCMSAAKKGMKPIKERDLPRNRPQVNLHPIKANPAGIKHFYEGDAPPWDESLGDFRLETFSDGVRISAYGLEQDALALRAEADRLDEEGARP